MLNSLFARLWNRITLRSSKPQANEAEAVEFRKFYQKEIIEACRALGYDIQPIEDDGLNHLDD